VAVLDLDGDGATAVAASLDVPTLAVGVDVAEPGELVDALVAIEEQLGPIDVCCANAGILALGGPEAPDEVWRSILDVNVMAHVWAARELVPRMIQRGGGAFLVTASAAGLLTQIGAAPYAVSKHAAVALAEWLAVTYGDRGLDVTVLCPQAVNTAMIGGTDGGVAGLDGVMDPAEVAEVAFEALEAGTLWALPHPDVATYARRRAEDPDRWLSGMQRLQARLEGRV
jgi:NAD(P)-dependent dehydrogenase (short-subunit alcohol dehydrogenase family)